MFNPDPITLQAGYMVMAYGLGGVFTVLILFYFATKIMLKVSIKMQKKKVD